MNDWFSNNSTAIIALVGIITPVFSALITLLINNRYKKLEIKRNKRNDILINFAEQYGDFTIEPNQSLAFKLQATSILLLSFCKKKSTRTALMNFSVTIRDASKKTPETDDSFKQCMSLIAAEKI